jgi:hypothetical protein
VFADSVNALNAADSALDRIDLPAGWVDSQQEPFEVGVPKTGLAFGRIWSAID